jgi:hypothetical protein
VNLLIERYQTGPATLGKLFIDGQFVCYTLEDPVREIPGQPVSTWKIHGKTAIPSGDYRVSLEHSPRFGPDTLTIHSVPGFVGVRMHGGNTVDNTEGCPLLGLELQGNTIKGGTSRPAVDIVKRAVKMAQNACETIRITIKNP